MSFTFADSRQLWLDISPTVKAEAWQTSQVIPTIGARWQVYLNQLCISTCLDWFQTEVLPSAQAFLPSNDNLVAWELVTGSCIDLNGLKLVMIPTDLVDRDELLVPQEWVDIPDWTADYYLAATVNPGENWVELWGYTSYQELKANSSYDSLERLYSVDTDDLKDDINGLWAVIDHCSIDDLKAVVSTNLAELFTVQAENLVNRLAGETFPRLAVPFTQWGALLANPMQRQALYGRRLAVLMGSENRSAQSLTGYLQGMCDSIATGWQSIETVFKADIRQLATSRSNSEKRQAKLLCFGEQSNQCVRLVLLWTSVPDDCINVQAQLYPAEGEAYLPLGIEFTLLSEDNEQLLSIQSQARNNYIQLNPFTCSTGDQFALSLELDEYTVVEKLTV